MFRKVFQIYAMDVLFLLLGVSLPFMVERFFYYNARIFTETFTDGLVNDSINFCLLLGVCFSFRSIYRVKFYLIIKIILVMIVLYLIFMALMIRPQKFHCWEPYKYYEAPSFYDIQSEIACE
ncbi:hypothetical protein VN23_07495 [Janthinobacterium sp. B9-8]|nr:hypothetical protein VN23_07495 [Janthinobacterium sp. B9-8]